MKILISSHAFAPSIGGIETVSRLLAQQFRRLGHDLAIVTQSPGEAEEGADLIVRAPSARRLFELMRWCDLLWQNNLSLRTLWPALLLRKPAVVTHQGSYCRRPRGLDFAQRLKRSTVNRLTSVAISHYVASCFKTQSIVIPNPYDAALFNVRSTSTSRRDLVFVGRLVSEKGVDTLLAALAKLTDLRPRLTIVGSGPEEDVLRSLTSRLGLQAQVTFTGPKPPDEVARLLNEHRILVVPSKYDEPFGVVALEGIACGCVVVGSSGGGLPEAIGPCGVTFANGDANALANSLRNILQSPDECERLRAHAPAHLARFQPETIANAYVDLFRTQLKP